MCNATHRPCYAGVRQPARHRQKCVARFSDEPRGHTPLAEGQTGCCAALSRGTGGACRELLDSDEQQRRFDADRERRVATGIEDIPIDNALLAAMDCGLPDCCGVAVGFDRIIMSIEKLPDIVKAISFGFGV